MERGEERPDSLGFLGPPSLLIGALLLAPCIRSGSFFNPAIAFGALFVSISVICSLGKRDATYWTAFVVLGVLGVAFYPFAWALLLL